eukprot:GEMP01020838.1.p1 GENE.GEMP01020838.1~~GEMP01020838.1.p1  ORF type:complete len:694 (+),score=260.18 GEMP01020838.1:77-2158(+)
MLLLVVTFVGATVTSPVEKVVEMLEDLRTQVLDEGKAEAKTYNEFACFCKDTGSSKREAVQNGIDQQAELEATLGDLNASREAAAERARAAQTALSDLKAELDSARAERKATHKTYSGNALDLSQAITAIRDAVEALEASQRPQENASMLSMSTTLVHAVRRAALIADAWGVASTKPVLALLQEEQPENNTVDYSYHSVEIISTLKKLEKDLVSEKQALDEEEVGSKSAFDQLHQRNSDERLEKERELAKEQENEARLTDDIGIASQSLTDTTAKLHDDQQYLAGLTQTCNDKAATWDQRVTMRADELTALTQATDIIKDTVTAKTTNQTIRFIQKHGGWQAEEHEEPSFVQLSRKSATVARNFLHPTSRRDQVVAFLRQKSDQFKSAAFATLASAATAKPFEKITALIQKLIDRLLEEAQNEQDHNNWCKTQTDQATQQRTIRADEVKKFNNDLEKGEARRDKLNDTITTLSAEIGELEAAFETAQHERTEEKDEHARAVTDAKEGMDALAQAETILRAFYEKKGAAGQVALDQVGQPYEAAPDAGFKNFEAYKGSQSASKGVLGMIAVIQSDFQRTVEETERAEHEANLAFIQVFEGENKASQDEKNKLRSTAQDNLATTNKKIDDDKESLVQSQDLVDRAVQELIELNEACVKTEMSYEERVRRREDEIQSLKQALCILDKEGPVQTGEC